MFDRRSFFVDHRRMSVRAAITYDRGRAAVARVSRHHIDMNSQAAQGLPHALCVCSSDESDEHDIAAQLAEDTRDVTSLAARLSQNRSAPLNFCELEIVDLNDAVDRKIRADDEEHPSI